MYRLKMEKLTNEQKILKILFKDYLASYNSRNISKLVGLTHAGAFKILKKLEKREIVKAKTIGKAVIYSLDFENPVCAKEIGMILTVEALNYKRWYEEFKKIKNKAEFAILFGSILRNEKEAKDIDLLVVSQKSNFSLIKEVIEARNKLSNKKVHLILQSIDDFKKDLFDNNKVTIEIIKTGVVLFGQNNLINIFEGDKR